MLWVLIRIASTGDSNEYPLVEAILMSTHNISYREYLIIAHCFFSAEVISGNLSHTGKINSECFRYFTMCSAGNRSSSFRCVNLPGIDIGPTAICEYRDQT